MTTPAVRSRGGRAGVVVAEEGVGLGGGRGGCAPGRRRLEMGAKHVGRAHGLCVK